MIHSPARRTAIAESAMTDADIDSAAHVLTRKYQRGELTADEYELLETALRHERARTHRTQPG